MTAETAQQERNSIMRNNPWQRLLLAFVCIVAGSVGAAHAKSSYMTQFNSTYPTAPAGIKSCVLCHPSYPSITLNSYASAFLSAGHQYAPIEGSDSDADGFTNIAEIKAGTFPGNAASHPVADATPPTVSISSPVARVYKIDTLNLGYTVSDGTVKVFVDGVQKNLVSGNRISGLANGAHTVRVSSTDAAGNVGSKTINFTVNVEPILATSLSDINANGKPEIVALLRDSVSGGYVAYIKDGGTKAAIRNINFGAAYLPAGFCALADLNGNGKEELAVLGKTSTGSVAVVIKDAGTGATLKTISFSATYNPVALAEVSDITGNGKNELAVLGVNPATGGVAVVVKDIATGVVVKSVGFPATHKPLGLAIVADVSGNSAPELAVLAKSATQNAVFVKDAVSAAAVKTVSYPATVTPLTLVAVPDVSGNGADELVVVGIYASGQVSGLVNDAFTGLAVKTLAITPATSIPQGAFVTTDLNGNASAELGVIGLSSTGAVAVNLKDTVSGLAVGTATTFPARTM
jgi:hypothetical protein